MLDGALTLNGDVFYYIYKNYQISRIVDRTAINDNFNAHVRGAELEASWATGAGVSSSTSRAAMKTQPSTMATIPSI